MELPLIGASIAAFLDERSLTPAQLEQVARYLDLLVKWNAKTNLTAIRNPEEILRRHFGESFFAASQLFPQAPAAGQRLIDFGSGAGFPGLPIKILLPDLRVTLIESQNKKATFLREVVRSLDLAGVDVHQGRAEQSELRAETVTMRAVEKFEESTPTASTLLKDHGRLALLVGAAQAQRAKSLLPALTWREPVPMPDSAQRVLLVGQKD